MSRTKVFTDAELRAEAARRRISQKEIAKELGVTPAYVYMILRGLRDAPARRKQIQEYIKSREDTNEAKN